MALRDWIERLPEAWRYLTLGKAPTSNAAVLNGAQDMSERVKPPPQPFWSPKRRTQPQQEDWRLQPPPYGSAGEPYLVYELEEPLVFDYPTGVNNLIASPRTGYNLNSFNTLRRIAALAIEIRLPIELLKREVRALEWDVKPQKGVERDTSEEVLAARKQIQKPDGVTTFDSWVNMLLEEVLVTDAPTLYPHRTRGGDANAVEIIDGATICPLVDGRGRVPLPPVPAYVQVLKGVPAGSWTRAQLWYAPYNRSIQNPYGSPPVEDIIITVNTALRRAQSRLTHYTEGNVPEALVGLPAEWTRSQIQDFQEYWDALVAGDVDQLRRMKFFPVAANNIPVHEFTRTEGAETQIDEWLLRVGCWAVGVSPAEFGLVPGSGLGGRGFADAQSDVQYRMGLGPLTQYLKTLFDAMLHTWGYEDLEFSWVTAEQLEDKLKQAQIDQIYLNSGVYSLDYVQEREGVPPEQRPDAPPAPAGGGFFGLAQDAEKLAKAEAGMGEDDPDYNTKTDYMERLRAAMLDYLQGLQGRVMEAVDATD